MNINAKVLHPYYVELNNKVENEDFVIDKSGVKTVELIAPRIVFTNPQELTIEFSDDIKTPIKYLEKEHEWYDSKDLNIEMVKDVKIWQDVSDENNEINSNYGSLVHSRNNFSQFDHACKSLLNNPNSRQAIIIYNRPSIHLEYNSLGASDFICTMYQHFFIRNNKLITITTMRSNDARFGIFNDLPWFHTVINKMHSKLLSSYETLEIGEHIFIPDSFHIYERHFSVLERIAKFS